jgi:hypothetical protein
MSFIDPDLRERWAEDAKKKAAECAKYGHSYSSIDTCVRCSRKSDHPRVVAEYCGKRGVFRADRGSIIVEHSSVDAAGDKCWVFDSEHKGPLVDLLVYGTTRTPTPSEGK